jgi:hypothetical protein
MCKEMMTGMRLKINQRSILRNRRIRKENDIVGFKITEYGCRISMELDSKDYDGRKSGLLNRAALL